MKPPVIHRVAVVGGAQAGASFGISLADEAHIMSILCPSDNVGDVLLIGIYGGAICNHYRIVAKATETAATLVRVNPISSKNSDGTFSTQWETV